MKKIFLISCILNSLVLFSQETVSSIAINLAKKSDVFQSVNEKYKETTLFINDKLNIKALRLNEKMELIDSISTQRPNAKVYDKMIGYNLNDNNTRLFWSSNNYEEVFTQEFDFKNKKIATKEFSLLLKDEKILQKFSGKDNFYILSLLKNNDSFKLHIFNNNGGYFTKIINLNKFTFFNADNTITDLYGVFKKNLLPFEAPFTLQNIDTNNPTSITESAKKRKCYFTNEKIIITFDDNVDHTQVLTIDLNNFSVSEKIINQVIISEDPLYMNSNSYCSDNKLYQIKTFTDQLYFTIKDLDKNLIKEYKASPEYPIDFKNSDMALEGSDFGGKRTLENSSQFIRKINNLNVGISSYKVNQNSIVVFGGVSASQQSGGQVAMSQFGLLGAIVGAIAFNPTMENFNSYANRKVVKTEGLFDNNGNHIKGNLQPLAFDKIRIFFEANRELSLPTLFKTDSYYLGSYDNKTKEYTIRKFND